MVALLFFTLSMISKTSNIFLEFPISSSFIKVDFRVSELLVIVLFLVFSVFFTAVSSSSFVNGFVKYSTTPDFIARSES